MYERILVPLDGSKLAEVALAYAEEIAERSGSRVTLMYVSELAGGPSQRMNESYIQNLIVTTKQAAKKKQGSVAIQEFKLDSKILTGHPAEEIVDYAQKENIDLIVMSTHGKTGIKRWTIGSVADKVVKAASKPVMLIRAKGDRSDMREKDLLDKVLVPLDGSKGSEAVIPYIEELASKLKMEVTFLQALELSYYVTSETQLKQLDTLRASAQVYIESMAARFRQKGISAKAEVREISQGPTGTAEEIMKVANEIQADIVAMSTRGRGSSEERPGERVESLGSVAEKMVNSGNTPLFLVRPEPKKK